jgi:uncharacterized heparinase superfamily protein
LIAYDDVRGTPVANAVHSGYQRLEAGSTVVVMDTGRPPPFEMSAEAHAGCLSFELSSKAQRILVNCGVPGTNKENWREISRSTRAHSTVTFNDVSSCRFADARRNAFGAPIVAGPVNVPVSRDSGPEGEVVQASHDGYASRFSVVHQRTLALSADGNFIDGEDAFLPTRGEAIPNKVKDSFAVRFHLHPSIRASKLADGHSVMLILPNRDVWNFSAYEDVIEIEDTAYLGGQDGPRRSFQLVIYGGARRASRVRWSFNYAESVSIGRSARPETPELPL